MTGVIVGFAKAETFIASFVTYQFVDEGKKYRNGVTRLWKDRVATICSADLDFLTVYNNLSFQDS